MSVVITKNKKIREVQQDFNLFFPYLQVEFFTFKSEFGKTKEKVCIFDRNRTIGEFSPQTTDIATFTITPTHKLNELEKEFQEKFGLAIQVFRKSGRVWLDTISTNSWTMEQQNRYGEELCAGQANTRLSR